MIEQPDASSEPMAAAASVAVAPASPGARARAVRLKDAKDAAEIAHGEAIAPPSHSASYGLETLLPDWVTPPLDLRSPELYLNRELTWLELQSAGPARGARPAHAAARAREVPGDRRARTSTSSS